MEKFTSFGELGKFVKEQKPSVVFTDADAETVYHEILNSLKMGKPRSMEELVTYVGARGYDKVTVETAVYFMRNNNVLSCGVVEPVVYWLTHPYAQMSHPGRIPVIGNKPRKQKEPEVLMNTTKEHNIQKNDDLDVAIWKAMQDHKPRSASEISKILVEYGFEGSTVRGRVISLMMKKTWFDRKEKSGQDTRYVLKKTCPNPILVKETPPEEAPENINSAPQSLEDLKGTVFYPGPVNGAATTTPAPEPLVKPVIKTQATGGDYQINHNDPIHVAVWKIVRDRKNYTIDDIVVLVKAADHFSTPASIRQKISFLNAQCDWFISNRDEGSRKLVLKLKIDVTDPKTGESMETFVKNMSTVSANTREQPKPVQEKTPAAAPKKPASEPVLIPQFSVVKDVPLFEFSLKLKGVSFTLAEFKEVLGFVKTLDPYASSSIVEVNYKIRGVDFTASELKEISAQFYSFDL